MEEEKPETPDVHVSDYSHVVKRHNLGVGVVPAVPVALGGPGVDTVGAAAAGEHHRVAGVEVTHAAHVVAQLQDAAVVFVVFECLKKLLCVQGNRG